MPATLLIGPAACGKTHHILEVARRAAHNLVAQPIICVPTRVQRASTTQRLAAHGGALGVRVLTFDTLNTAILAGAAATYVELDEAVQYRLMRDVVESAAAAGALQHFGPIVDKPGLIAELRRLVAEFKGARVPPASLLALWTEENAPARLRDLATVYAQWQARLVAGGWVDLEGIAWLAVEALEQGAADLPQEHTPVIFDGFDSFTAVQRALVQALATNPSRDVIVTLTGDPADTGTAPARSVHRRFHATRRELEETLGVAGAPLPSMRPTSAWNAPLLHLRDNFLLPDAAQQPAGGAVEFIEASTRALEVRAALRWLKRRILQDGVSPSACALLARSMQPYRQLIDQTSAEFGMRVHIEGGLPLAANPAIATILQLLRVLLPGGDGEPTLPRRTLAELWRSPYLDLAPFGVQPGDVDSLDAVGRHGLVAGGLAEWRAAFHRLGAAGANRASSLAVPDAETTDVDEPVTTHITADVAQRLSVAFEALVSRLRPCSSATVEEHVRWLEEIIGDDVEDTLDESHGAVAHDASSSLSMMRSIGGDRTSLNATAQRDFAAMRKFKELLRGLIWAEEVVGSPMQPYATFAGDLAAAVEATSFRTPTADESAIFAGETVQARGVPYQLVAVLGMAEGELPARIGEDPFLRETDRTALRKHCPGIRLSTESAEAEFFLDTIARPQQALLLVRPRISTTGAMWEPSIYWHDLRARVDAQPHTVALGHAVAPTSAASLAELLESLAVAPAAVDGQAFGAIGAPLRARLAERAQILGDRVTLASSPWDGDLRDHAEAVRDAYPPAHTWSATAIESYISCPLQFFMAKTLQVEARVEPEDGPGPAQIGTLYHRIMERLYRPHLNAEARPPLDALLDALPAVAAAVLGTAPMSEGFRAPPSWPRTCEEMVENVRRALHALDAIGGIPIGLEYFFGAQRQVHIEPPDSPVQPWPAEGGAPFVLNLRGVIDRVDRLPDGSLLIIDYKLGSSSYASKSVLERGKKLQLALYAAAAQQSNDGGASVDGIYFFMRKGEAAAWSLASLGGAAVALPLASGYAGAAVAAIRDGDFRPRPPDEGCPTYCPASSFCWHFETKQW